MITYQVIPMSFKNMKVISGIKQKLYVSEDLKYDKGKKFILMNENGIP